MRRSPIAVDSSVADANARSSMPFLLAPRPKQTSSQPGGGQIASWRRRAPQKRVELPSGPCRPYAPYDPYA